MATEEKEIKANPAWKLALVVVPLFLIVSSAWAMWIYYKKSREVELDSRLALPPAAVSEAELAEHLRKLRGLIGERSWDTPAGRVAMRRAIAFIEGTLSPQNYGFLVEKGGEVAHAGELWPTVWAELEGKEARREVVLVMAPYDGSAARVAAVLVAANALRADEMRRSVRFVFAPARIVDGGRGGTVDLVMARGESLVETLAAAGLEEEAEVEAVAAAAEDLVAQVRKSAREGGKNP